MLGAILFYKGASANYIENFSINYERIKMVILLLCLITIFIAYYNVDPGGYITKYFGESMLITIILSVFAFLYLIIILLNQYNHINFFFFTKLFIYIMDH